METKSHPNTVTELLRQIPSVDDLLGSEVLRRLETKLGHRVVLQAARTVLQNVREGITKGTLKGFSPAALAESIATAARDIAAYSLEPVINATGVILHTNLGRAPLARRAVEHIGEIAGCYSNLEYNLGEGKRGKRDTHTDRLFAELVGAERTLVVNNNAAAVFLTLNALAEGGEVIVSRGELIEIGGSFRIPDICAKSGARLKEAGTTNRTRLADYAGAINESTKALLRVHPSNFRVVGFAERPELAELAGLAHQHHLPLIEDLGSGCLIDLRPLGIPDEPPVGASLKEGADVVTFSGDKLLGGAQAGLICGKREFLDRIRRNPLFRALRVDKLTIAALEATTRLYLDGNLDAIPALRMMRLPLQQLSERAELLVAKLAEIPAISARVEEGQSVIGGGSTPGHSLPARLVAVQHAALSAQELEAALRRNHPPVIARVERDRLLLDLRTVFDEQEAEILRAFERLA
ncbi:MAG TPA: L-seryl-tRNA(Sec) selenium transferase [Terriglobia bacterium]|nr:L-seryl-tRNA(Sec) selenium transferase [Terriglobia bacterium]